MTARRYLWVGALAFVVGVLALLPSRLVLAKPGAIFDPTVRFYGLHGSIWRGSADVVQIGLMRLEGLHWALSPAALLTAALSADLTAQLAGNEQSAEVTFRSRRIKAENIDAGMPLSLIGPMLGWRWLPLAGQMELRMPLLRLYNNKLQAAEGQVTLRGAQWTLLQPAPSLGDISATVSTDDNDQINAEIENSGGSFTISGRASLAAGGEYLLDVRLQPRPGADPSVQKLLEAFGQPQPDGSRQLKLQGKLAGAAKKQ